MRGPVGVSVTVHGLILLGALVLAIPSRLPDPPPPARPIAVSLARLPAPAPPPPAAPVKAEAPAKPAPTPPKPIPKRVESKPSPPARIPVADAAPPPPAPESVAAPAVPAPAPARAEPAGAPDATPESDWLARLRARIEQGKRYPVQALKRREEGMAVIRFTVSRDGQVSGARIIQGSGSDALDREALDLPGRSAPLPPMPDAMAVARLELTLPIGFALR